MEKVGLTAPRNLRKEEAKLMWDSAFAGETPIKAYEIIINGKKLGELVHKPQTLKNNPFVFETAIKNGDKVEVAAVDQSWGGAVVQLA